MKKLFRFHRGLLADSLATTIEVAGLAELQKKIESGFPQGYLSNIRIKNEPINDPRLPEEWNGVSYYVVADFDGYEGQCIGMSNFYEEVMFSSSNPKGNYGIQVSIQNGIDFWDRRAKEEIAEAEIRQERNAFLKDFQEVLRKHNAKLMVATMLTDNGTPYDAIICTLSDDEIAWAADDNNLLSADNVFDYEE